MYHKIGFPPAGSKLKKLWVSPEMFRWQLVYLKKHGYTPVTFGALADTLDRGLLPPPRPVVITLDDGYQNNHDVAFPILQEFGFPAVIYLVVNAMERDNFWHDPATEARLPMLNWEQVRDMEKAGIEFGSHTLNHPRLTRLTQAEARQEIAESRRLLTEKLTRVSPCFANPYGDGADSPDIQNIIQQAGYRWAVSVHQGKASLINHPYCLRRLFIRGDDTRFDFHLQLTRGKSRF